MLQMAQMILFIASVDLYSLHITAKIRQVQRGRFLKMSMQNQDASEDDNAYLSHRLCDYE